MVKIKGIDVSVFQPNIDWKKVKADGVEFAIIKATQGKCSKHPNGFVDSCFEKHYAGAKAAGIKVGAYHFAVFTTAAQAKEEAQYFISALKNKQFEYPLCLDLEDLPEGRNPIISKTLTKKQLTDYSIIFMEEVKKAGYRVMLYTYTYWRNSNLDYSRLKDYLLWQAHYPFDDTANKKYPDSYRTMDNLLSNKPSAIDNKVSVWQCTGQGKVNGISGNVDMNWGFVDLSVPCEKVEVTAQSQTKTVDELAKEVIAGKWGNGQDRKDKLIAAGYDYTAVQTKVNALLKR